MALATYSDLKTAILEWQERVGDTSLTSRAEDIIALAEAGLNRSLPLRLMRVNTTLTGTAASRNLTLPSDYIEPVHLARVISGSEFEYLSPSDADSMVYVQDSGTPTEWCINGSNIDLNLLCDSAHSFQFRYRKKFALSDSETTNWLLTNAPDIYLYECLKHAGVYTKDPEYASALGGIAAEARAEVKRLDARSQSRATLKVDDGLLWNRHSDWWMWTNQ